MARVLVIDDEPNIRLILNMALTEEGHEVITAKTGKEGWEILHKMIPHAVLIDLKMPGITGKDLILMMRKSEQFKNIPVFLLTGSLSGTEDFPPAECYQGLFEKPFDIFEVSATVSNITS